MVLLLLLSTNISVILTREPVLEASPGVNAQGLGRIPIIGTSHSVQLVELASMPV